ncbi:MAG: glycoside hydrolase family 1 protein [Chthoniobacterales bacterium]|nr:glycoside hydrolase family 1 protein [Chthoniobacterales bacterium]
MNIPMKGLLLLPLVILISGCANLVDPLGPIGKGPVPRPQKSPPHLDDKFAWGISTASFQYEDPDVKPGQKDAFSTDWDILISQKKAPKKGNALYTWTKFEKDLAALRKIGVTHYRFSIEWARVEPKPGVYDEEAIARYAKMARLLKEAGIEPVICLWHFTFPDWLYDKKSPSRSNWLHPLARERWNAYVNKMVRATAPHTNFYAPQNEPNGQITTAYIVAQWPPCMTLAFGHYWKAIEASTGMFRDAATRIKKIKPSAKVVSVEALPWWERAPLDPGGLIYNTMMHGNVDHLDRVYDVCDIVGFNYYYAQSTGPLSLLSESSRHGHNFTMMGWRIDPNGLFKEIQRVGNRYGKPMMITENGIATRDDAKRVWYMRNHLAAIGKAIRAGYDMRGYFAWSLADNYEWHYGYKSLFGLSRMDPKTYDRVLKPSAKKFAEIIKSHPTVRSVATIPPQANFSPSPN